MAEICDYLTAVKENTVQTTIHFGKYAPRKPNASPQVAKPTYPGGMMSLRAGWSLETGGTRGSGCHSSINSSFSCGRKWVKIQHSVSDLMTTPAGSELQGNVTVKALLGRVHLTAVARKRTEPLLSSVHRRRSFLFSAQAKILSYVVSG